LTAASKKQKITTNSSLSWARNYFCKVSGKYLTFRHRTSGQKRNIRTYTLGDAYKESAIRQRIATGVYIPVPEEEQSLSYSQKLHQIESMFRTKGVLRENNIQNYKNFRTIRCIFVTRKRA
jgi:hypothetical protein